MTEENSKEAYKEMKDELGEKQMKVLTYIQNHPNVTYNDVCRGLGWRTNTTTARIKELREKGYIVKSGDRPDPITKRTCATYRVREDGESAESMKQKHPISIKREHLNALLAIRDTSIDLFKDAGYSTLDTLEVALPGNKSVRVLVVQGDDYAIMLSPNRGYSFLVFKELDISLSSILAIYPNLAQGHVIVQTLCDRIRIWLE